MTRFSGKNILVIGAYSGIGRAAIRRLASEGAAIVAVGRREEKLREVLRDMPGAGHQWVVADAASWEQLQPVIQMGRKVGGFAGGVVCAGLHEVRPLAVLDASALHGAIEANLTTALMSTRAHGKNRLQGRRQHGLALVGGGRCGARPLLRPIAPPKERSFPPPGPWPSNLPPADPHQHRGLRRRSNRHE